MDIERLCELATKATGHTLRYHSGANSAEAALPAFIRHEIQELYHLRDTAQDTSVADLEIACDAALSVAEAYNSAPQHPSKINLRWFYICVQGLLLVDIKPELLLDGKVGRLPRNAQQQKQPSQPDSEENASFSPAGSSPTLGPGSSSPASSPEPSAPSTSSSSSSSGGGGAKRASLTKPAKAKWEDDEIQLMIELKASGMRHSDVATRLGRGQGSVENKYGRIMHLNEWKDYFTRLDAKAQQKKKR